MPSVVSCTWAEHPHPQERYRLLRRVSRVQAVGIASRRARPVSWTIAPLPGTLGFSAAPHVVKKSIRKVDVTYGLYFDPFFQRFDGIQTKHLIFFLTQVPNGIVAVNDVKSSVPRDGLFAATEARRHHRRLCDRASAAQWRSLHATVARAQRTLPWSSSAAWNPPAIRSVPCTHSVGPVPQAHQLTRLKEQAHKFPYPENCSVYDVLGVAPHIHDIVHPILVNVRAI